MAVFINPVYLQRPFKKQSLIQYSENLVTGRWTDKSDFTGCCPTNVECPKEMSCQIFEGQAEDLQNFKGQ